MNLAGAENGGPRPSVAPAPAPVRTVSAQERAAAAPSVPKKKPVVSASSIFDAVITVSLVALFFGLPLFFTGLTFQGIAFEKQMYFYLWLLVGVVAWVSRGVITGELRLRKTPLDIPLVIFWAFYCLTALFSVDRWHSFWGFFGDPSRGIVSVTALVLAYYLIMNHFSERRFRWMFGSFLASGVIVVLWSFLAIMGLRFMPAIVEQYAPLSLIGTVSTLAVYLSLLLPLFMTALFMLGTKTESKKGNLLRWILRAILLVALLLALFLLLALYSFVPWIVVLGGLSFFLIYILAQIVRPAEQWTWIPMVVFVVVLAFLMVGNNSLARVQLPVEVSPNSTLSWQIAKGAIEHNFFVGVGPAAYGYAFSMFRPENFNQSPLYTMRFYQGNGLFFEAIASIGLIGAILMLILWLSFLSIGFYLLTREKQHNKLHSLGLWSSAVMFLIATFIAPINGPVLLIGVLLSALALATLLWESQSEARYLNLSLKAAPKFALALAFIFMVVSAGVAFLFVFMGKVFIADLDAGKAARLSAVQPSADTVTLLLRAVNAYPQEGRYYTRAGQEYMALANVEASKPQADQDTNQIASLVRQSIGAAEQGRRLMPNDVLSVESLGLLYENAALYANDAIPKAQELYSRAQELEPHNPLYFIKLGQLKRTLGDAKQGDEQQSLYKEAEALFLQSIDEKQNLGPAYYQLSLDYSRLKDFDKAIDNTQAALKLEPDNLTYKYNLGVLYQLRNADGDYAKAEEALKSALQANDKLIDVRLSLGLLYERENKRDDAISQYRQVLDLLPADGGDNIKSTRDQIQTMISNVQSGRGNISGQSAQPATEAPAASSAPASTAPAGPNQSPLSGQPQP